MKKKNNNLRFQGDIAIVKVKEIPKGVEKVSAVNGQYIVAHSETGHHHVIMSQAVQYFRADATTAYLDVKKNADLIHMRNFDTHVPINLDAGRYKIIRQKEFTPSGWRKVVD